MRINKKQSVVPVYGCVFYLSVLAFTASALLLTGCGKTQDPILLLSSEEALNMGKQFLTDGKYSKASKHLTHAFEVEPNSRTGREALLLAADALYLQGGTDNLIKCEAKYRDFLNRFPTSDRSDYAQYKVAACLAARGERPDRDQKITRDALAAFQELLRLYPTSEHLADAREQVRELTDRLAAHELAVAEFYNNYGKFGICDAAISRLEGLQTDYPDYRAMDAVLYNLGVAYSRCLKGLEANKVFEDLRRQYPDSPYIAESLDFEKDWAKEAVKLKKQNDELERKRAAATGKSQDAPADADAAKTDASADEAKEGDAATPNGGGR